LKELQVNIDYVEKIHDFFENNQHKEIFVIGGGRGKGATWGIGNELIQHALQREEFILCTREIKESVDYSSRRVIERLITRAGLKPYFIFHDKETICKLTGARFIYTGLSKITEDNVQGTEGITKAWLGEAHKMALSTYQKFEPTVRENNAKVYIDYNVQLSHTPIHHIFTEDPESYPFEGKKSLDELAYLFMDYRDNTLCPEKTIRMAERHRKQYSLQDWEWMWLGKLRDASEKHLCTDKLITDAFARVLPVDEDEQLVVGIDCAHMGGDEITMYKRRGFVFLDDGFKRSMMTSPEIFREFEAYVNLDKSCIVVIDNGHVGAAVADIMEEAGYYVERVNFGGTKEKHFDPEHCKDAATDMAFNFVDMLPQLSMYRDDILKNQIVQRRWNYI